MNLFFCVAFAALSPFNVGSPKANVNTAPKKPTEVPSTTQMVNIENMQ